MLKSGLSVGFLFALAGSAYGTDLPDFSRHSIVNDRYSFSSGIGYSWIKADEIAYKRGNRISHVFWETQAPVVTAELGFNPIHNFTVHARGKIGFAGGGEMNDYDWLEDYFRSYQFEDWTDHSRDENINLDRYINADVAVGYDFHVNNVHTINLNGGLKYTNIKWTSFGSELTYSVFGYRDFQLRTSDSERGISYEQRLPALFLGAQWSADYEKLSFSALGRLGTTVSPEGIDHHWQRDTLFNQKLDGAPFLEVNAVANYRV